MTKMTKEETVTENLNSKLEPGLARGLRLGFQNFHLPSNKVSVAQLIERLTHKQEDPG